MCIRGSIVGTLFFCLWASPVGAAPVDDAWAAEEAGDDAAAVTAWQAVIDSDPTSAKGYLGLGGWHLAQERPADALKVFDAYVEAAPEEPQAYRYRARALLKAGRPEEAVEGYRAFLKREADDPDGLYGLANALRAAGRSAEAIEAYRAYLDVEDRPKKAKKRRTAKRRLAQLEAKRPKKVIDPDAAFARGDFGQATDGYRRLSDEAPEAAAIRYRRAVSASMAGRFSEAEQQAAHAARLDPGNESATRLALTAGARRRAEATPTLTMKAIRGALRDGRLRTALRWAGEALDQTKKSKTRRELLQLQAVALAGLSRYEDAELAVRRAALLGGVDARTFARLAMLAQAAGEKKRARTFTELAQRTAPIGHPLSGAKGEP